MAFSCYGRKTEQKALTMALEFISKRLELKDMYLNQKYGLNRCTLGRIRKGEDVPRAHEAFMRVFIRILNEQRLEYRKTMDFERVNIINRLLRDMLLVEYGFATDDEIFRSEK